MDEIVKSKRKQFTKHVNFGVGESMQWMSPSTKKKKSQNFKGRSPSGRKTVRECYEEEFEKENFHSGNKENLPKIENDACMGDELDGKSISRRLF